jgi:hypothetical protein
MTYALAANRRIAGLILLFGLTTIAHAEPTGIVDTRTRLGLTEAERTEFLAQMRQMLASVEGIARTDPHAGRGDRGPGRIRPHLRRRRPGAIDGRNHAAVLGLPRSISCRLILE